MSVVETVEPVIEESSAPGEAHAGVVGTEVGRMLDEFFEFAHELERSLSTSGALRKEALALYMGAMQFMVMHYLLACPFPSV